MEKPKFEPTQKVFVNYEGVVFFDEIIGVKFGYDTWIYNFRSASDKWYNESNISGNKEDAFAKCLEVMNHWVNKNIDTCKKHVKFIENCEI